ncbi:MAG: hypothetical protein ACP5OR_02015 [Candidatus Dormibacteria bacterium]
MFLADISSSIASQIASPLLTGMQFLIPLAVAMSGIHKLMNHQESAGGFLVEILVKGGGAILVIQLIKTLAKLP